jgi:hypothetical protein
MVIRRPGSSFFKDKPKSKELVLFILEKINSYRYPNEPIEDLIDDEKYYEMPLIEADFGRTVVENIKKSGIKGV